MKFKPMDSKTPIEELPVWVRNEMNTSIKEMTDAEFEAYIKVHYQPGGPGWRYE
jgi:ABC-type transport system involved in cytochrome c biogenesis ATPase subunit